MATIDDLNRLLKDPPGISARDITPAEKLPQRRGFFGWLLAALRLQRDMAAAAASALPSSGLSSVYSAGTGVAAGGGTVSFRLSLPYSFVEVNALQVVISNIAPGPGISSFDLALYDTAAHRDAGTFSASDAGIQFLAPTVVVAAGGPSTYQAAVLGLMQGDTAPAMYGLLRNNDVASTFDATIAVEAYGRRGQRAV